MSPVLLSLTVLRTDGVGQYRLIQEAYDHLVLQLVLDGKVPEEALSQMRAGLLECLGESLCLDIQVVDAIPEEKLKFRKFISRLPRAD